ncbi:Lrp/AsnC family transcriptional regulator [Oscillospiraceae bacterium OttesenSCG-928-F05]|nr:Lrp/AsnC family transcriptional regulator [Oscillospiraceae bacterium OttesenSCG-928-F05]
MESILKLLENDCRLTAKQIGTMLGVPEDAVTEQIKSYEKAHVILGYRAVVDWERAEEDVVTALIEVRVTPQRGEGFERVAERIYQYDEVESLYLMSGGYDLSVTIKGKTMKEVALFVARKLAPIEGVSGTATHFILKKYKENGVMYKVQEDKQERAYIL